MEHRFPILNSRADANYIVARDETLHSLLDGRARNPDGSLRQISPPLYERMKAKERLDRETELALSGQSDFSV